MRAGGGEDDADPVGSFDDPARDLEQVQSEGGELGGGQLMRPGDAVAQGQQQPVGGGVQDQADLVGQMFGPGIWWCGSWMNLDGSSVQALQMAS